VTTWRRSSPPTALVAGWLAECVRGRPGLRSTRARATVINPACSHGPETGTRVPVDHSPSLNVEADAHGQGAYRPPETVVIHTVGQLVDLDVDYLAGLVVDQRQPQRLVELTSLLRFSSVRALPVSPSWSM
jgi:hypothetical protein